MTRTAGSLASAAAVTARADLDDGRAVIGSAEARREQHTLGAEAPYVTLSGAEIPL